MTLVTHMWLECDKCGAASPSADNNETLFALANEKGWVIGNFTPLSGFGAYGTSDNSGRYAHMHMCAACGKWIQAALDKAQPVTEDTGKEKTPESISVTDYVQRQQDAKRKSATQNAG